MSKSCGLCTGLANLLTASNSFESLYNPMVVINGVNSDEVANPFSLALLLSLFLRAVGLNVILYSSSSTTH